MDRTLAQAEVVSATPGRVRLRLRRPRHDQLQQVKAHLDRQQGIHHVAINGMTGSILIHSDHHRVSSEDILTMCHDLGVVVGGIAGGDAEAVLEEAVSEPGQSKTAENLVTALDDLDQRLSAATGRNLDLKLVVPLSVGALGLRQLVVEGLGQASGYLLLWVAFDMFFKLHRQMRPSVRHERTASRASRTATANGSRA